MVNFNKIRIILILAMSTILLIANETSGQVPNLRSAAGFILFTGGGDLGNSKISQIFGGNIGTNLGTITGFEGINTTQYIQNSVTSTCLFDLQTVINQINTIPITQTIVAATLTNRTFTPGVYLIASAVTLSASMSLDAMGNSDALFIFNVEGAFNVEAAASIILRNGASAQNVFWNVNDAIGFGAISSVKGNFISHAGAIAMGAGVALEGRALTINGAINLDNNILATCLLPSNPSTVLSQPTCSLSTGTIAVSFPLGAGMTYSIDGFTFDNTTGIFTTLSPGTYTVIAKNQEGCMSWTTVTLQTYVQGPNLGSVSDFILFTTAGAIGNTGALSVIDGGVIGTNFGAITGFDPTVVKYINNAKTAQASLDLATVFSEIHNIPPTVTITSASLPLAGTYIPGVYFVDAALNLINNITFDAQNNPEALFIFNVTGDFTAAAGIGITLIHGASANNIFWNIDGTIGIGAMALMKGTFISRAGAIDIGDGAILQGRAYTIAGAINMYNNQLNVCVPPPAPALELVQPSTSVATGTITISNPKGSGMTYRIDNCTFNNTTGIFALVEPGNYLVTVKNSDGCISSGTLAIIKAVSCIWAGSNSNSWNDPKNWSRGMVPSDTCNVIIPDGSTTLLDPVLPITPAASVKTLTIQFGGIVEGGTTTTISIAGAANSWLNRGIFNPGTSNVIFTNKNATIADSTDFYNLTVATQAGLTIESGAILRIDNTINLAGTAVLNAALFPNTINFNGSDQTIINPNGSVSGYYNLILSGNGTKIMSETTMSVLGNFFVINSAIATAGAGITVGGNFNIGLGAAFFSGTLNHYIGGDFYNDGTFTDGGGTVTCNGTLAQTIGGNSATTFRKLAINNTFGVTLISNALTTVTALLKINSGKLFIIAPGKKLTVSGIFTNNAGSQGFILQSDASGTASLIHQSNNVPATVKRYISGISEAWHFLSSPVLNQSIGGTWLPPGSYGNGTGYDLYLWNEPSSCWIYNLNTTALINWNTVHSETNFVPGRGYLYAVQAANPTKDFTGNLNNGTISYPLTKVSTDTNLVGFNLVGNPFPSSIDWNVTTGWERSSLVPSGGGYDMWIWNPEAGNYGVCNSASGSSTNNVTRSIAPMQGYFVKALLAGSLSIDNRVRRHEEAGNWKKEEIDPGRISLVVKSETDNNFDEVQVQFGYSIDMNGSSKLFSPVTTAPSLFFISDGIQYSLQYLNNIIDHPVIPVMFKPGRDGNYLLTSNFTTGNFNILILEDRKLNIAQDLNSKQTYQFNALKTDDTNRFFLHFGLVNLINNLPERELKAKIYSDGSHLIIDLSQVFIQTDVMVYDCLGRKLFQQKLSGGGINALNFRCGRQFLVVRLLNTEGIFYHKLLGP